MNANYESLGRCPPSILVPVDTSPVERRRMTFSAPTRCLDERDLEGLRLIFLNLGPGSPS